MIEADLLSTLFGSYVALEQFRTQPEGGILINVASAFGTARTPDMASSVAAKQGVVGLGVALRQELSVNMVENIRICTEVHGGWRK